MIVLKDVCEIFPLRFVRGGRVSEQNFEALSGVNLEIRNGETVCLVGRNGSGKTTLLKVIAGLIDPTRGTVKVDGRTGVIMDIGCGFHPDLTGRENLLASAPLYALSEKEVREMLPDVERFAELGRFFDAPLRSYSQGMFLRLAFAFAVHLEPEILLIDDIIAVGDERARFRCLERIERFRRGGTTVILVTHDLDFARRFAPRTVWIDRGGIVRDGSSEAVLGEYHEHFKQSGCAFSSHSFPLLGIETAREGILLRWKSSILFGVDDFDAVWIDRAGEARMFDGPPRIDEIGARYVKMRWNIAGDPWRLECVIELVDSDRLRVEWFRVDPRGMFRDEIRIRMSLPWRVRFSDRSFPEIPYPELAGRRPVEFWSRDAGVGLEGEIRPAGALELKGDEKGDRLVLEARSVPPAYPAGRSRIARFEARVFEEAPLSGAFQKRVEAKRLRHTLRAAGRELYFTGSGFRLKYGVMEMLEFGGIEALFDYRGVTWSSTGAEGRIRDIGANRMAVEWTHPSWPRALLLKIVMEEKRIRLRLSIANVPGVLSLRNLRLQVVWSADFKFRGDDGVSAAKNAVVVDGPGGMSAVAARSCPDGSWLFMNDYREKDTAARVTSLYDPAPSPDTCLGLDIDFFADAAPTPPRSPRLVFEAGMAAFQDGSVRLRHGSFDLLSGWMHYCALFCSPTWHDSTQCSWEKTGAFAARGRFPRIPVILKFALREPARDRAFLSWSMRCLEPVHVERVQWSFPLAAGFRPEHVREERRDPGETAPPACPVLVAAAANPECGAVRIHSPGTLRFDPGGMPRPFLQCREISREGGEILNFTWWNDPVTFAPGEHPLGELGVRFEPS
jgi:ABC-type polysaccharide/polyol phosphate transport system ATPase subunit